MLTVMKALLSIHHKTHQNMIFVVHRQLNVLEGENRRYSFSRKLLSQNEKKVHFLLANSKNPYLCSVKIH